MIFLLVFYIEVKGSKFMLISNMKSSIVFKFLFTALLLGTLSCNFLTDTTQDSEPSLESPPSLVDQGAVESEADYAPLTGTTQEIEPSFESGPSLEDQGADSAFCNGAEVHSIGESISKTFEIPYEEVMRFFCDGYKFEEILLALETQAQTEVSAESILQMRDDGLSWDQIWHDLGLINLRKE
jgi:hypothetical protein